MVGVDGAHNIIVTAFHAITLS